MKASRLDTMARHCNGKYRLQFCRGRFLKDHLSFVAQLRVVFLISKVPYGFLKTIAMSCTGCSLNIKEFLKLEEEELFNFMHSHNVMLKEKVCPKCGAMCTLVKRTDTVFYFRCTAMLEGNQKKKRKKVACNFQESVRKNTFFDGTHFPIPQIAFFVMLDVMRVQADTEMIEQQLGWSRPSVIDWKSYLREVYIDWSIRNSRPTIGGPGRIVEIDEAKVGKRKYNCGRLVEGQWVFGGIDRQSGEFFIVPVESRNTETLLEIIKNRIADGTTIISDCWKSYNCLSDEGYQHQTVNHSKNFVDPDTRAHTQNIERLWRDLKANIPRYGRRKAHYVGYLARFEFFKKFKCSKARIHEIFMAIGQLYDPNKPSVLNPDVHFEDVSLFSNGKIAPQAKIFF